jgi:hypothetical protein
MAERNKKPESRDWPLATAVPTPRGAFSWTTESANGSIFKPKLPDQNFSGGRWRGLARGVPLGPGGDTRVPGPHFPCGRGRLDMKATAPQIVDVDTKPPASRQLKTLRAIPEGRRPVVRSSRSCGTSGKKDRGVLSLCCPERVRLRNSARARRPSCWSYWRNIGSPSRTRTCDHSINSRMLYQLSYRGSAWGAI